MLSVGSCAIADVCKDSKPRASNSAYSLTLCREFAWWPKDLFVLEKFRKRAGNRAPTSARAGRSTRKKNNISITIIIPGSALSNQDYYFVDIHGYAPSKFKRLKISHFKELL